MTDSAKRPWLVVYLLFIAMVIGYIHRVDLSSALPLMSEEFGWSATQLGQASAAFFWIYFILQIPAGYATDRWGVHFVFWAAFVIWCGATLLTALTTGFAMLVGLRLLLGIGQSILTPAGLRYVRLSFPEEQRGTAVGIYMSGTKVGPAVGFVVCAYLLDAFGWRDAWTILGITGSTVVLVIARLVLRNRPEDMGLVPDGAPRTQHAGVGNACLYAYQTEHSWTLHDAVRTGAFWRMAVAFGTLMFGMSAIGLFWVPYFIDHGFAPSMAAWALSAYATSQAGTSILLAPLVDRYQPRFLAMFGYASFFAAFLLMMNATVAWQLFTAAALGGAGVGSGMLLQAHMWPGYFGRANIGRIRGAALPLSLTFSGVGSAATGFIFDATNSYAPAWWTAVALLVVGAALLVVTPKPMTAMERAAAEAEGGS